MKKTLLALAFMISLGTAVAQDGESAKKLPSVTIKTLDGKDFNTADIQNDGKPIIVSFWATWCRPCLKELTAFSDNYEEWQAETGVKIYAISTDDARTKANVLPMVNGRGWEFDFFIDTNGDFKRAMSVSQVPHTFILNGKG
ncbi:MAG: TlpA family protein disulfide reductase, partial [Bacteroidales bacterium]|nr:TlpA family protein disulfide reductase [Bacteroidales bacterium]